MMTMPQDPGDDDIRAGEYVLGLLDPAEARTLEIDATKNRRLSIAIADWERRLQPLLTQIPAVPPPASLWTRIETEAFARNSGMPIQIADRSGPQDSLPHPGLWRNLGRNLAVWRAGTIGFALAAAFAGIALLHRPAPPQILATMLPPGQTGPVVVAQMLSDGRVAIVPIGRIAPANGQQNKHDLELWSLPTGATKPVSLGVMSASGTVLPAGRLTNAPGQIMISLEPRGGSPTGLPTGPVVWAGTVTQSSGDRPVL